MTDIAEIAARAARATPGPWRSMRDGNQYIDTTYMPTAKCVGASRVDGIVRPWNPHGYIAHGFKPREFETARFLDNDADFIAHARTDVPALLTALAASQARVEESIDALNEDALVIADTSRRVARLREVLTDLVGAVVAEVNDPQKGGSGYLLARLSDARAAIAEPVAVATPVEE